MLWWFAETTLIAGLLAAAAALLGRRQSIGPTARHLLWLVVLIKLVMPPLVKSPWPVPRVFPSWPDIARNQLETPPVPAESTPRIKVVDTQHENLPRNVEFQPALTVLDQTPAAVQRVLSPQDATEATHVYQLSLGEWLPAFYAAMNLSIPGWVLLGWGLGTIAIGTIQAVRIIRFRRRLGDAVPVPDWLSQEAQRLGSQLEVSAPEILAVPGLVSPMLWCLGRPVLLVPCRLVKSIDVTRWRGILAHELAHLRRGDQWVGRLELLVGLIWWWNPLYWLAQRRLDAEAELACDSWVVRLLPDDRLVYAEVLVQICSEFSLAASPAPALGVAGSGQFFERRLSMILQDRGSCRISLPVLLVAGLFTVLALPSWTTAKPAALLSAEEASAAVMLPSLPGPPSDQIDDDDDKDEDSVAEVKDDDDDKDKDGDDDDNDDNDEDDDDQKAKSSGNRNHGQREKGEEDSKNAKESGDIDVNVDIEGIAKKVEGLLGPDFEKNIQAWAEKLAHEMESKFGDNSEFVKKMETLGKEMEKKFGDNSEFAKKMETLGKEMEKKFGDNSEFAKKMETLGKEMEKKFGPGSEFEKKIQKEFGPGSDFEKRMKDLGKDVGKKLKETQGLKAELAEKSAANRKQNKAADIQQKPKDGHGDPSVRQAEKIEAGTRNRAERIQAIESRINQLMKELKALKAADTDRDEESEK